MTTGKSTMETVRVLEALGAEVIGVACIVDRRTKDCAFALPVYAALKLGHSQLPRRRLPHLQGGRAEA